MTFADHYTTFCASRAKVATGARHTLIDNAVATPTGSGVFLRPNFMGVALCHTYGYGRGASVRKAGGMALSMCLTPRPPVASRRAPSGFQSHNGASAMTTQTTPKTGTLSLPASTTEQTPAYTPEFHASTSNLRPLKLLALSEGDHGKRALFEFNGGFQRHIDIAGPTDAWHPIFSELNLNDAHKLREYVAIKDFLQKGEVKFRASPLAFISRTLDKDGARVSDNFLDVENEEYMKSSMTGARCALELLREVKRQPSQRFSKMWIEGCIREAILIGHDKPYLRKTSRGGAAETFIEIVVEAVWFMATAGDFESYMERKRNELNDRHDACIKTEKEIMDRNVARMVAARKAKRAAKAEATDE